MSKARLVITAVIVEGRSQGEAARAYGVSQGWVSRLVARYRAEGTAAFQPRSRRPKTSPTATSVSTVELIIRLRKQLSEQGLDAGPDTIAWHLRQHHQLTVSRATISRILTAHGLVTPQPKKRPRWSYVRFQAAFPTKPGRPTSPTTASPTPPTPRSSPGWTTTPATPCTYPPTPRSPARSSATPSAPPPPPTAPPASTLTDNGMVFTTRLAGGRGGRNALEAELRHLHVAQKNASPNHPTTCGKVERFQQTLKKWLAAQPVQPPPSPTCRPCSTSSPPSTTTSGRTEPCPTAPPPPPPTTPPQSPPGHQPRPPRPHPPPPRPHRPQRRGHLARGRPPPPPRRRTNPRPNPRAHARRRPPRPHRQRRHWGAAPRTDHRPQPRLPTHRPPTRPAPQTTLNPM
jgi:transposase